MCKSSKGVEDEADGADGLGGGGGAVGRGGNGTFGADAGTQWGLDGAKGVYVVEDAYRPGAIAPGALAGRTIAWSFLVFREFA